MAAWLLQRARKGIAVSPAVGALLQEATDVVVILNALRAR
jgi:hypothetical protein